MLGLNKIERVLPVGTSLTVVGECCRVYIGNVTRYNKSNFRLLEKLLVDLIICSDEHSWKKSRDLLEKVGRQGDLTGYRVSCLLIGAKDDLTPYPRAVQDSVKVLHINSVKRKEHDCGMGKPLKLYRHMQRLNKFSTVAAIEEPIKPPVKVEHTQLLFDGKFVDAATS
ncbi:Mitochondrial Rho GTPase 2 [Glycine max]|nr:Mitochondrial Rho GTPase 2 [Glycine max]